MKNNDKITKGYAVITGQVPASAQNLQNVLQRKDTPLY